MYRHDPDLEAGAEAPDPGFSCPLEPRGFSPSKAPVWSGGRVGRRWYGSWNWPVGSAGWGGGPSVTGLQKGGGAQGGLHSPLKRSSPTSVLLRAGLNFLIEAN